jgi:imidazoleglycerol-phosphate dehydratase
MNKQAEVINFMERIAEVERKTKETSIRIVLKLVGSGKNEISTGIPFFDHMLTLFAVHGFFDLSIDASGDIDVDFHHTIEDVGLVLGDAFDRALGDRKGIKRFGHAVTPMDDALASVAVDLSKRPFLVYNVPARATSEGHAFTSLTKEFLRAFSNRCGMNLHVNVFYGENEHHIIESIFKAVGRALGQAASFDDRIRDVRSSKGVL